VPYGLPALACPLGSWATPGDSHRISRKFRSGEFLVIIRLNIAGNPPPGGYGPASFGGPGPDICRPFPVTGIRGIAPGFPATGRGMPGMCQIRADIRPELPDILFRQVYFVFPAVKRKPECFIRWGIVQIIREFYGYDLSHDFFHSITMCETRIERTLSRKPRKRLSLSTGVFPDVLTSGECESGLPQMRWDHPQFR